MKNAFGDIAMELSISLRLPVSELIRLVAIATAVLYFLRFDCVELLVALLYMIGCGRRDVTAEARRQIAQLTGVFKRKNSRVGR